MAEFPNSHEFELETIKQLRTDFEAAFSNAQKTGDYREAEKLKEELDQRLTALEAQFPKPEPKTDPVKNSFEKVEKGETTLEKAKEIMGEDYFGTEAIKKAFEINVGIYPIVPYSEAELRQAKSQGEMLVYRMNIVSTMEQIVSRVQLSSKEGNLLEDITWYKNEDFFLHQTPRSGWALVSKDLIQDSTAKDYIGQTRVLRDHLIELESLTAEELNEVTEEKLEEIRTLMNTNLKAAAKQLSELKINQNHRRTPVEALYDFVIRFKNTLNKERMLGNVYDCTNTLTSGDNLVNLGSSNVFGISINVSRPDNSYGHMGVVSVR